MPWPIHLIDAVFEKTGGECYYCGREIERALYVDQDEVWGPCIWWVDNWLPRERCSCDEEYTSLANLVPICRRCRGKKGSLTGDEFVERIRADVPSTWSDAIYSAVFEKTAGHCAYCAAPLDWDLCKRCDELRPPDGAWNVDRWNPPDRCDDERGADVLSNLVPACSACIRSKGPRTGDEYVQLLRRLAGLT